MPRALTSVLLPTGPWVRTQQRHQGSAASLADTMARRRQLRLRAARCVLRAAAQYAHGAGGVLNVHHDRNHGKEARLSTLMVYLTTVAPGHGGETYFPAAGAPPGDALAAALQTEYRAGRRILERDSQVDYIRREP